MIVLLSGTSTARPSISSFAMCVKSMCCGNQGQLLRRICFLHHAISVVDVIFKLIAKMLDETLDRKRGGIAKRADRTTGDVIGDGIQLVEVFRTALPMLDPVDHAVQPAGAFTAGCTLSTRFLEIEIRQAQESAHHASRFIHYDYRSGSEHRAG